MLSEIPASKSAHLHHHSASPMYPAQVEATTRPLDVSIYLWQLWECQAVDRWLATSRSKWQLLKRMEIACCVFKNVLHWKLQTAYSDWPNDNFGLDAKCFDLEEFNWEGVKPTAEAERQIIEYAADVGNEYIAEEDVTIDRIIEICSVPMTHARPFHETNRTIMRLLGPGAAEICTRR